MRKLIVTTLMSVDGVVGSPERLLPLWNDENKSHAVAELADVDAFLFGRVTFETFAARWPSVRGDAFADALNALPKYVASRTLRDTSWAPTTLWSTNVSTELERLKKQRGKNIMKYGLGQLDRALLGDHLVDELRISVVPIVIGSGRRLFEGLDLPRIPQLQLTDQKTFGNGVVRLTYAVIYN
ncbi:MAG: bifunctional deaminase-reductase domain protein [Gemmatimonadetes bacterium]|nr:bifunctional deaminase-reductase domain protein [Gemmatimonadota bacterium]